MHSLASQETTTGSGQRSNVWIGLGCGKRGYISFDGKGMEMRLCDGREVRGIRWKHRRGERREEGGGRREERRDYSISSVSSWSAYWRCRSLSLSSYASYTSLAPANSPRQSHDQTTRLCEGGICIPLSRTGNLGAVPGFGTQARLHHLYSPPLSADRAFHSPSCTNLPSKSVPAGCPPPGGTHKGFGSRQPWPHGGGLR
jgi:hypothetical protein